MSPGWQSSALQIASNVESRIAFAFPFFSTEMFAIVMPTLSASSVTLIFRFANMTSMLMMMAIPVTLHRQVVLRLYLYGALQKSLKYGRRCGNYDTGKSHQEAHGNTARNVILTAYKYEKVGFCRSDKTDK
jgi:hypothetical protein